MFSDLLYFLGSSFLLFWGVLFLLFSSLFLLNDYVLFLDWELLMLNSCSLMLTLLFDWMTLMFLGCVFLISSMVIFYSESYMVNDFNKVRFYFLVLLFVISMMMMIVSPNLISILVGWDGLGLVSYCLVVYFQNWKSYSAGMLTVLTNRIGDVAILLSIAWVLNFGSWHFIYYLMIWEEWESYLMMLLVMAGFTSSAQVPFSSWLPAAMAAPTPVSSLVHSSTLVTAGVYLLVRFSGLFCNMNNVVFLGLSMMTMIMASLTASFEFDLKKVIALSTLSQLGFMMSVVFMGLPILAFLHLLVHAFFSALLFMCAGVMIHSMGDIQDMRCMGMVSGNLPYTSACFLISNLSLCGFPFMAGFYSKDIILELMLLSNFNFFVFLVFYMSVGITAFYTIRMGLYLFNNVAMYSCQHYSEDKVMMKSMLMLAVLSIISGSFLSWLIFSLPNLIVIPFYLKLAPLTFVVLGSWLGYELMFLASSISLSFRLMYTYYFFGSMWALPVLSTGMMAAGVFKLSKCYFQVMDGGWGELSVSQGFLSFFSFLSSMNNYYFYNNISIYLLGFVVFMIFSLV